MSRVNFAPIVSVVQDKFIRERHLQHLTEEAAWVESHLGKLPIDVLLAKKLAELASFTPQETSQKQLHRRNRPATAFGKPLAEEIKMLARRMFLHEVNKHTTRSAGQREADAGAKTFGGMLQLFYLVKPENVQPTPEKDSDQPEQFSIIALMGAGASYREIALAAILRQHQLQQPKS